MVVWLRGQDLFKLLHWLRLFKNSVGCPHNIDTAFAAHSEKWHPAMRRLADTPAKTLDGVLFKLRILAGSLVAGRENIYDEDTLLLAIADLERLLNDLCCKDIALCNAGS